jgi:hypothetical protein
VSGCFLPARSLLRIVAPGGTGTDLRGPNSLLPCAGWGRSEPSTAPSGAKVAEGTAADPVASRHSAYPV